MKRLLFILFFIPILSFSQGCQYGGEKGDIAQICDFYRGNNFSTNLNAEKALDRILNVTGMAKRFVLYQCSDIDNCVATAYRGVRYILYDKEFMEDIANNSSSWTNISILAHEIGHHVNGHSLDLLAVSTGHIDAPSLKESREMELEADEYSGFVMQKLGATLYQAQAAIKVFATDGDDTYSTHPSKSKRLAAVERGFNNAKNSPLSSNITVQNKYNYSAESYYLKALNAEKDSVNFKIENYTKCINLNYKFKSKAFFNRALIYKDLGDNISAINDFNEVIYLDSKNEDAYFNRAKLFMIIGEYSKAVEDYNFIIEKLIINEEEIYLSRAESFEKVADFTSAINDYTTALKINQNNSNTYIKRGKVKEKAEISFCYDFKKACQLNNKEGCELFNMMCDQN